MNSKRRKMLTHISMMVPTAQKQIIEQENSEPAQWPEKIQSVNSIRDQR